jgi:hypothetical protein
MDRYTKVVLTVIALALALIALNPWLPHAAFGLRPAEAQGEAIVSKDWGKAVGVIGVGSRAFALFEASDGTLRIVYLAPASQLEGAPFVVRRH